MPQASLEGIILFVKNVSLLAEFYTDSFGCVVVESMGADWQLLDTGGASIGLHKIPDSFHDSQEAPQSYYQNTKLVFMITENLEALRNRLLAKNISMRSINQYPQWGYEICDGEDPEGNVFQLKRKLPG